MKYSKTTQTIIEMVEKHRGLYYLGSCLGSQCKGEEFKGREYVIQYKTVSGEYKIWLKAKTQKELIAKLSQVTD